MTYIFLFTWSFLFIIFWWPIKVFHRKLQSVASTNMCCLWQEWRKIAQNGAVGPRHLMLMIHLYLQRVPTTASTCACSTSAESCAASSAFSSKHQSVSWRWFCMFWWNRCAPSLCCPVMTLFLLAHSTDKLVQGPDSTSAGTNTYFAKHLLPVLSGFFLLVCKGSFMRRL